MGWGADGSVQEHVKQEGLSLVTSAHISRQHGGMCLASQHWGCAESLLAGQPAL